ncbi:pentatricopeptide repeat-containing protein mitochondrial [Dorcoceras hygrometricum]|uniref:Pentatricopeptide repeat-containing protein mitochondrial n=1 Tax=Dorcoceras hygrometricum TaxID=472368 RepID=A0A2Z7BUF6_9LAMI|nr:pentatricopeptide repeat-containing protein mitochondrial [Dorcoceras hygrometricum]
MEHTGMAKMFKYLEDTWVKGFLEASSSLYEAAMLEFFANAKVIAGMIMLVAMVNNPNCRSQGFTVKLSVLLERLVKADLGESVKLHTQKVLNNKSVHTYIKKNLNVALPKEPEKAAVEKLKKKKERVGKMVKKQKVIVQQPVEARSQVALARSMSETSLDADSCPLAGINKCSGAKRKMVVESLDRRLLCLFRQCLSQRRMDQENKEGDAHC